MLTVAKLAHHSWRPATTEAAVVGPRCSGRGLQEPAPAWWCSPLSSKHRGWSRFGRSAGSGACGSRCLRLLAEAVSKGGVAAAGALGADGGDQRPAGADQDDELPGAVMPV
jgi:hypothetical protein